MLHMPQVNFYLYKMTDKVAINERQSHDNQAMK